MEFFCLSILLVSYYILSTTRCNLTSQYFSMNCINILFLVFVCVSTYTIDVNIDYLEERFRLTLTQDEKRHSCLYSFYLLDTDPEF